MGQVEERTEEECSQAANGEPQPATARLCNLGKNEGMEAKIIYSPPKGPCEDGQSGQNSVSIPSEPLQMPNSPQQFSYAEPIMEEVNQPPPHLPQSLALLGVAKDQPMLEGEMEDGEGEQQPRRLTLRVGGFANLYEGWMGGMGRPKMSISFEYSTSVKVKCPVNAVRERRKLIWSKNGRPLKQNRQFFKYLGHSFDNSSKRKQPILKGDKPF
jgi:hypothetical protein